MITCLPYSNKYCHELYEAIWSTINHYLGEGISLYQKLRDVAIILVYKNALGIFTQ